MHHSYKEFIIKRSSSKYCLFIYEVCNNAWILIIIHRKSQVYLFLGSGHDDGSPNDGDGDVGVLLDAEHTERTPRGRPTSLDLLKPRSVTPPPAGSWLRRQNRDGRR